MNSKFKKRLLAYFIDILIFSLIVLIIWKLIPESNNLINLKIELNKLNETFLNNGIEITKYSNQFSILMRDISMEQIPLNIINAFLIVIYFVFIPYFYEGRTIGKKIVRIKIIRNDNEFLMLNDLLVRNFIVNGLAYLLISLALIFIIPDNIYFLVVSILGFIQILLVFISAFMVLYRKDNLGLHDILSRTKVIDEV